MQLSYGFWFWFSIICWLLLFGLGRYFERLPTKKSNSARKKGTWFGRPEVITWLDRAIVSGVSTLILVCLLFFGSVMNAIIFCISLFLSTSFVWFLIWLRYKRLYKKGLVEAMVVLPIETAAHNPDNYKPIDFLFEGILINLVIMVLMFLIFLLLSSFIHFFDSISNGALVVSGVILGCLTAVISYWIPRDAYKTNDCP